MSGGNQCGKNAQLDHPFRWGSWCIHQTSDTRERIPTIVVKRTRKDSQEQKLEAAKATRKGLWTGRAQKTKEFLKDMNETKRNQNRINLDDLQQQFEILAAHVFGGIWTNSQFVLSLPGPVVLACIWCQAEGDFCWKRRIATEQLERRKGRLEMEHERQRQRGTQRREKESKIEKERERDRDSWETVFSKHATRPKTTCAVVVCRLLCTSTALLAKKNDEERLDIETWYCTNKIAQKWLHTLPSHNMRVISRCTHYVCHLRAWTPEQHFTSTLNTSSHEGPQGSCSEHWCLRFGSSIPSFHALSIQMDNIRASQFPSFGGGVDKIALLRAASDLQK